MYRYIQAFSITLIDKYNHKIDHTKTHTHTHTHTYRQTHVHTQTHTHTHTNLHIHSNLIHIYNQERQDQECLFTFNELCD